MATPAGISTMTSLLTIATSAATSFAISTSTITSDPAQSTSTQGSKPGGDENTGECQLLGPFAVLVQGALGLLALLSLVFKRWRERPQRPVKIWAFDASKQVFGSVLLHLANLLMSMFSAGEIQTTLAKAAADKVGVTDKYQPNPCSFYLLNLAIDTTIGIPILIIILKILSIGASYTPLANPPESIKSGHYGDPPRATWWLKQSMIYFVGLLGMKTCVFFIFQLLPWIVQVGDWALRWTEGNEAVQIAFVMFIFPLVMNGIQYYIIDMFIKKPIDKKQDSEHLTRDGNEGEYGGLLAQDDDGHGYSGCRQDRVTDSRQRGVHCSAR
jgi:STIMATE family